MDLYHGDCLDFVNNPSVQAKGEEILSTLSLLIVVCRAPIFEVAYM